MYKRLFIAININPTEALINKIEFLKNNLSHDLLNWIREDHYHLTLKFLGKTPIKHIPKIETAIKKAVIQNSKFSIQINAIRIFGSTYKPTVLWLGIEEEERVLDLYENVVKELNHVGYNSERQNFVPHISVARIKKIGDKKFFQMLLERGHFKDVQVQQVGEIVLYESILGVKGAEYSVVKKFKLRP